MVVNNLDIFNNTVASELTSVNNNEVDGIEILVNMAKQGKIDPWQIDIIDITNKYLAYICNMKSQDLRLTGQTFLFASMLIKSS